VFAHTSRHCYRIIITDNQMSVVITNSSYTYMYMNWRDVQRKNVVNNVDVKFKGTISKWPVQILTHRMTQKHVQHHDATDI